MNLITSFIVFTVFMIFIPPGGPEGKENAPATHNGTSYQGTIVAFGDSLTEGYGIRDADAYPAQLERRLLSDGRRYRVINAGITGETSSGALSRVRWVLNLKPDIVILETGANDGMRGIQTQWVEKNIDEIIRTLKDHNVTVVLAGMQVLTNLGSEYTTAFKNIYQTLARKHNVILIPFFLAGVAGEPRLNLPDGIHPTSEGYAIVLDTVYPYVIRAIEERAPP